jgi:acyl-coenzyme A thioesterase 13
MSIPEVLQGFTKWGGLEPFEDQAGPFFMKLDPETQNHISAMVTQPHHMNGGDFLHGGLLMTFADYALFVIAHDELGGEHAVTVSCHTEFLSSIGDIGEVLHATGNVTRNTRSLIFIRGQINVASKPDHVLATFSGIVKRVHKK